MAHAKRYLFNEKEQLFASYNQALGHPARRRIIGILQQGGHCCFDDIMEKIPLARSTVQIHLRTLKGVQLIKIAENDLKEVGYVLNTYAYEEARLLALDFWQD